MSDKKKEELPDKWLPVVSIVVYEKGVKVTYSVNNSVFMNPKTGDIRSLLRACREAAHSCNVCGEKKNVKTLITQELGSIPLCMNHYPKCHELIDD